MIQYLPRGDLNYVNCPKGKKSRCFSPGSDFKEQFFTRDLSGVDSPEVLRPGVCKSQLVLIQLNMYFEKFDTNLLIMNLLNSVQKPPIFELSNVRYFEP